MVVDVCDYFDTDLPAAPLPHFGLCEQAVQVLLTHGNHLAALQAWTQGRGLQHLLKCQGFQQGSEHTPIVSKVIKLPY